MAGADRALCPAIAFALPEGIVRANGVVSPHCALRAVGSVDLVGVRSRASVRNRTAWCAMASGVGRLPQQLAEPGPTLHGLKQYVHPTDRTIHPTPSRARSPSSRAARRACISIAASSTFTGTVPSSSSAITTALPTALTIAAGLLARWTGASASALRIGGLTRTPHMPLRQRNFPNRYQQFSIKFMDSLEES